MRVSLWRCFNSPEWDTCPGWVQEGRRACLCEAGGYARNIAAGARGHAPAGRPEAKCGLGGLWPAFGAFSRPVSRPARAPRVRACAVGSKPPAHPGRLPFAHSPPFGLGISCPALAFRVDSSAPRKRRAGQAGQEQAARRPPRSQRGCQGGGVKGAALRAPLGQCNVCFFWNFVKSRTNDV